MHTPCGRSHGRQGGRSDREVVEQQLPSSTGDITAKAPLPCMTHTVPSWPSRPDVVRRNPSFWNDIMSELEKARMVTLHMAEWIPRRSFISISSCVCGGRSQGGWAKAAPTRSSTGHSRQAPAGLSNGAIRTGGSASAAIVRVASEVRSYSSSNSSEARAMQEVRTAAAAAAAVKDGCGLMWSVHAPFRSRGSVLRGARGEGGAILGASYPFITWRLRTAVDGGYRIFLLEWQKKQHTVRLDFYMSRHVISSFFLF